MTKNLMKLALGLRVNLRLLCTSNTTFSNAKYVPKHKPLLEKDLHKLQHFISNRNNIAVITGAGISTESGIPDYRSEDVGLYSTSNHTPIRYQIFISNEKARKRYWIRNFVGWPYFYSMQPNKTHFCLSEWQKANKVNWIITQNVDRLHSKAGSERVIELHGSSYIVKCINCGHSRPRTLFQKELAALNPNVNVFATEVRPDGDTDINDDLATNFQVPDCSRCNGLLKPDVVFFGDTVARTKVEKIKEIVLASDGLLVLGSSLEVYSGYRFVVAAQEAGIPVGIINIGKTRADNLASFKVQAKCSEVLSQIHL